ncbi:MAG: hypothetical protein HXS54_05885 [Theionarchaea archaeon]|nr:hypothetical protein [Theionarchaea archaeon]DBA34898.1 TPA_asm: hypothetical protein vir521_00104 [Caudoviricetes sp. vir521]
MSPFYPEEKFQVVEFIGGYDFGVSDEFAEKVCIYYKQTDTYKRIATASEEFHQPEITMESLETHRLVKQEHEVPFDVQERDRRGWELLGKIVNDQEKIESFKRCEGDLSFTNDNGSTLKIRMLENCGAEIIYCNNMEEFHRKLRVRQLFRYCWCFPDILISVILTFLRDDNDFQSRLKCGSLRVDEPIKFGRTHGGTAHHDIYNYYMSERNPARDMIYPVDFTKQ